MFQLKLTIYSLLVFSVFASAVPVQAATYYVATTGNDSNPGTIDQPFATVKKGVSMLTQPGMTLYLRGGTYNQGNGWDPANQIIIQNSGTRASPITITSYSGERARLVWNADYANHTIDEHAYAHITLTNRSSNGATISDWVIKDLDFEVGCLHFGSMYRLVAKGNRLNNGRVQIGGTCYQCLFDGNTISNGRSTGVYLTGNFNKFVNNIVYGSATTPPTISGGAGYGLQGAGYPPGTWSDVTVADFYGWTNNIIANNTFAYNKLAGIVNWQSGANNNIFENNIFYENGVGTQSDSGAQGIQWQSSGGNNLVKNNLFHATLPGSTVDFISSQPGTFYTESGSVHANPLFVNGPAQLPAAPDFQLQSGSPAIDKGLSIPTITTVDLKGTTRPQGPAYDIGAYEVLTGSADTTAPDPPRNVAVR